MYLLFIFNVTWLKETLVAPNPSHDEWYRYVNGFLERIFEFCSFLQVFLKVSSGG